MSHQFIYLFSKYIFYESTKIIMISTDYSKIEDYYNIFTFEKGNGYKIERYRLDVPYSCSDCRAKTLKWIEVDYDGSVRDFMKIGEHNEQ